MDILYNTLFLLLLDIEPNVPFPPTLFLRLFPPVAVVDATTCIIVVVVPTGPPATSAAAEGGGEGLALLPWTPPPNSTRLRFDSFPSSIFLVASDDDAMSPAPPPPCADVDPPTPPYTSRSSRGRAFLRLPVIWVRKARREDSLIDDDVWREREWRCCR
jgi:hypothetical protein